MSYRRLIEEIAPGKNARHIEAWMRCDHPTLDHLSPDQFSREVGIALSLIGQMTDEQNDALANSMGLPN